MGVVIIMKRETSETVLSAVFVDYDNVYLSLKRKSEEAAKRFAKESYLWIDAFATGKLITPTNSFSSDIDRRLVMNRCYGNPVPRRNTSDNATDMNSFAFVRHHFLRSGFEIIDCPPLTAQLKNSADIRMVMDIRDFLDHKTNFNEFIILSSDADFTPVLHRLRAHAKRTVIFTNDNTVAPYTALSDGEVREADLIAHLLGDQLGSETRTALVQNDDIAHLRDQIVDIVAQTVLEADQPVPLEVLAERATRVLGHEKTVGSQWAGVGSFREFLIAHLPDGIKLTDEAPYLAFEAVRALQSNVPQTPGFSFPQLTTQRTVDERFPLSSAGGQVGAAHQTSYQPEQSFMEPATKTGDSRSSAMAAAQTEQEQNSAPFMSHTLPHHMAPTDQTNAGFAHSDHAHGGGTEHSASDGLQNSIARIHAACEAPPFSPPEYRAIFSILEQEIFENQLQGVKTLQNVVLRAGDIGLKISSDDARYVLDAVTEGDPWLEQGVSANLFAQRFRNHVVRRCEQQGLSLSASELDLIDAWFTATSHADGAPFNDTMATPQSVGANVPFQSSTQMPQPRQRHSSSAADLPHTQVEKNQSGGMDWWNNGNSSQHMQQPETEMSTADQEEFPRIVRSRLRG